MYKLFTQNGTSYEAKATEDNGAKYVSIYEDGKLIFTVSRHYRNSPDMLLFGDDESEISMYWVQLSVEIQANFNQHFNYLNQLNNKQTK